MGSRANAKGRSVGTPRHVRLYHWLMKTPAWRSLDALARSAYVELAGRYAGTNNGRIPFSCREMALALNCSKASAMRAFRRLEQHGFVVQTKKADFNLKVRHSPEWRLTEFSCDVTGSMASKEFTRWQEKNTVSGEGPYGQRDETVRATS